MLSNCVNAKKKYFWHIKYTIQHSIERSQTTYNVFNTTYTIHSRVNCLHVFKSCIALVLSNSVNAKNLYMFSYVFQNLCWFRAIKLFECQKKKYILHTKYTIQHSIERSQTSKCIQYNIHDTQSCELPIYFNYIRAEKLRPWARCSVASNFLLTFYF